MPSLPAPLTSASAVAKSVDAEAVLAIDPGSHKCGMAVVCRDGAIQHRGVIPTEMLVEAVRAAIAAWHPVALIVGSGTGSKPLLLRLESADMGLPVERVDESHTSEAARTRFVAENPPRGWQRLLPRALRTPDRLYDDYVAVILAERYWKNNRQD